MTGNEIDVLVETAAANKWEELNEPDPREWEREIAALQLKDALQFLDRAVDHASQAAEDMEWSPAIRKELDGVVEAMQDMMTTIRYHRGRIVRGDC